MPHSGKSVFGEWGGEEREDVQMNHSRKSGGAADRKMSFKKRKSREGMSASLAGDPKCAPQ